MFKFANVFILYGLVHGGLSQLILNLENSNPVSHADRDGSRLMKSNADWC